MIMTITKYLFIPIVILIFSLNCISSVLIIRPRKDSEVLSKKDEIRIIKEFGDWLESCNYIIIDKDSDEKIQNCEQVQYFLEYGWRTLF